MGRNQQNISHPRTIVCCFSKFKEKDKILANAIKLKNIGIYVY